MTRYYTASKPNKYSGRLYRKEHPLSTKLRSFLCENIHWAFHRLITPSLQNYFPSIISFDPHSSPVKNRVIIPFWEMGRLIAAITVKETSREECDRAGSRTQGLALHTTGFSTSPRSLPLSWVRCKMRKLCLVSSGKHWDQCPGNGPWAGVEMREGTCPM